MLIEKRQVQLKGSNPRRWYTKPQSLSKPLPPLKEMILEQTTSALNFTLLSMLISHASYVFFVTIFLMSYYIYVTFYYSIVDSITVTYMPIEKRQVQPKRPEPASLVHKATRSQQTTPLPPKRYGSGAVSFSSEFYLTTSADLTCILRCFLLISS